MGCCRERLSDGNFDAELFMKFTFETFFGAFSVFDLAAREFPLKRQAHGFTPLGTEDLSIEFDDSACDVFMGHVVLY